MRYQVIHGSGFNLDVATKEISEKISRMQKGGAQVDFVGGISVVMENSLFRASQAIKVDNDP